MSAAAANTACAGSAALAARSVVVRVYGDSLSLPRATDGVTWCHTYAERVKAALVQHAPGSRVGLYNRSVAGTPIEALHQAYLNDCLYFGRAGAQWLIVQCGIVDCAPRPVPGWVRSLISRLPGPARYVVVRALHLARPWMLSIGLAWRLTSEKRFERTLSRWLEHAAGQFERTYVYNIAPTTAAVEKHSPGLTASILAYNAIIARVVAAAPGGAALVDVHAAIKEAGETAALVSPEDGHHITCAGHALYAERLLKRAPVTLERESI